jgi:hypothetical protein
MIRGIDKTDIFRDDQDRSLFLDRLGLTLGEGNSTVDAWALMKNNITIFSSKAANREYLAAFRFFQHERLDQRDDIFLYPSRYSVVTSVLTARIIDKPRESWYPRISAAYAAKNSADQ